MKLAKSLLILGLFALIVSLAGCCGGSGSNTTVVEKQPVRGTTLGDELIKLQEARDKGALSDKEYEDAKARLLKSQ